MTQCTVLLIVLFDVIILVCHSYAQSVNLTVGSCVIQYSEVCASNYVKFYISSSGFPEKPAFLFPPENYTFPHWTELTNDFKVIIHGYGGGIEYNQTKDIQTEYLRRNNTNIISVDWGRLAILPCYPTAVVNTKQAGQCISNFLQNLAKYNSGFSATNVHIIGFSLGAHVAAFASNSLKRSFGNSVQRITGLDPALPLFNTRNINRKLDATDAEFVDVIHTNAGIFGKIEPSGHADFYINGGQTQPQCNGTRNVPLCSHMMATAYFKESITSDTGFWGVRCSSYFQYIFGWCGNKSLITNSEVFLMGEKCERTTRGIIFVYTNMELPYAAGKMNLNSWNKNESNSVYRN